MNPNPISLNRLNYDHQLSAEYPLENKSTFKKLIELVNTILMRFIAVQNKEKASTNRNIQKNPLRQGLLTKTKDFLAKNKSLIITTILVSSIAAGIIYFAPPFINKSYDLTPIQTKENIKIIVTEEKARDIVTEALQTIPKSIEITDESDGSLIFSFTDHMNQKHVLSEKEFKPKFFLDPTKNHFERCIKFHRKANEYFAFPSTTKLNKSIFKPLRTTEPAYFSRCWRHYKTTDFISGFLPLKTQEYLARSKSLELELSFAKERAATQGHEAFFEESAIEKVIEYLKYLGEGD